VIHPGTLLAAVSAKVEAAGLQPIPEPEPTDDVYQILSGLGLHIQFLQLIALERLVAAVQRQTQTVLDNERVDLDNPPL